jgi:hypothetical protein
LRDDDYWLAGIDKLAFLLYKAYIDVRVAEYARDCVVLLPWLSSVSKYDGAAEAINGAFSVGNAQK